MTLRFHHDPCGDNATREVTQRLKTRLIQPDSHPARNLQCVALRMKTLQHIWSEDDGVLTFEWVLLLTILTIGIVGGLTAARDSIIDELGDVAESAIALDQGYRVDLPPDITIHSYPAAQGSSDSQFVDGLTNIIDDQRSALSGQGPQLDDPS